MVKCLTCMKELKNDRALKAHMWRAHTDVGMQHKHKTGKPGRPSHRKGLTKETSEEIRKTSEKVKTTMRARVASGEYIPRSMGIEARQRLSVEQSLNNRGGKCRWYEYHGQKLQGTWELNVAMKLDEMNIRWYKPKLHRDVWSYSINETMKSYTPDLYLMDEHLYLEIKGYWWGTDREKIQAVVEQNPDKKLIIIEQKEYNKILRGELVW